MRKQLVTPAATAALIFLTTAAVSAESPNKMNAEQGWSAISRCAAEDTERGRHSCVDRVLREAGLLTQEMSARQQRQTFGLDDKTVRATPAPTTPAAAGASRGTPAGASSPAAASSATASSPAAAAPSPAGAPSAPSATTGTAASTSSPAPSDRLEVELTKVDKAPNGWLILTTNEGAVWRQTESVSMPLPPDKGDQMTIRKGQMGGYRCSIANTHLTFRCARSR